MAYPSNDGPETDDSYGVAAGELRQFAERVERLEEDKREIQEDIKEVYAEAKGRGYDVKVLRACIKDRKKDKDDLAEFESVKEMYRAALGY